MSPKKKFYFALLPKKAQLSQHRLLPGVIHMDQQLLLWLLLHFSRQINVELLCLQVRWNCIWQPVPHTARDFLHIPIPSQ